MENNNIDKWMFADQPDELLQKVLNKTKTATCSLYDYKVPTIGEKNIILDSKNQDRCMIQIIDYKIMEYNEMTEKLAKAEGEKDLEEWQSIHQKFFAGELGINENDFNKETLILYEVFKVTQIF